MYYTHNDKVLDVDDVAMYQIGGRQRRNVDSLAAPNIAVARFDHAASQVRDGLDDGAALARGHERSVLQVKYNCISYILIDF